jgi:5'-3' exonuclease
VCSIIEWEADDALATAAHRCAALPEVEQVIVATPDKDLCQVVQGTRVITWDRRRDRIFDEDGVRARLGVAPASVPDLLGLVGEDADGIPGLPRWGARSAAAVLSHYGHLEAIPRDRPWDVAVRGQDALRASLAAGWDEALLYRRLATLVTDAAIDCSLETLRWRGPDPDKLRALCDELETDPPL